MNFEADNVPAEKLPKPAGWRILIAPVKIEETSRGGIVLVDEAKKAEEYTRDVGKVLALGPDCYTHPKFQGDIPLSERQPVHWCKVGDVIHYNSYTGYNVNILYDGAVSKLRLINDDEVYTVIKDLSVLNFV